MEFYWDWQISEKAKNKIKKQKVHEWIKNKRGGEKWEKILDKKKESMAYQVTWK